MSWVQASGTIFLPSAANTALVQTTAGATVVTMAFGLGAISPLVPSGMVPSVGSSIAEATPSVTMNGVSAQILSSVYIGLGVYAITVDRPPNANSRSGSVKGALERLERLGLRDRPEQRAAAPAGATGAPGNLTKVTSYSFGIVYSQGSVVFYEGSSYQSLTDRNEGNLPTSGANWMLIAQQGATGATGAVGGIGPTGLAGTNGANGVAGATGATGVCKAAVATATWLAKSDSRRPGIHFAIVASGSPNP
jgi:hypothetical protein